jgi:hypothetical protein
MPSVLTLRNSTWPERTETGLGIATKYEGRSVDSKDFFLFVACDPLQMRMLFQLGVVNLFHHHSDNGAKPGEEVRPASKPSPSPVVIASPALAISLSPLEQAKLCHALHRKVTRALKDLSLDAAEANVPVVIGGAGKPSSANTRTTSSETMGSPIV